MMTTASLRWIGFIFVAGLFSACGGDSGFDSSGRGDGLNPTEQMAIFPVEAVFTGVAREGVSVSASAVEGTNRWTLGWSITPVADQLFEGVAAQQFVGDFTVQLNGLTVLRSIGLNFFTTQPYAPLGLVLADGSYGVQTVPSNPLPLLAVVGAQGSLGTMTVYQDAQKSAVLNTQDATWSLKAGTDNTAFLCTHTTAKSPVGEVLAATTGCFKINTQGAVLGAKWTLGLEGKALTFQ